LRSGEKKEASNENQPQQLGADAKDKRAKKQSCLQRKQTPCDKKRITTAGKSGMERNGGTATTTTTTAPYKTTRIVN